MSVYADQTQDNIGSGNTDISQPQIVFTNKELESAPDLYITKNVESMVEGTEIPKDDEFTFTLRIDGELTKQMTYRLFDEKGTEFDNSIHIEKKEDDNEIIKNGLGPELANRKKSDFTGNEEIVPFKTDSSGGFTLKAGQTAVFEDLGSGTGYEVTEISGKEGYIQTEPVGGAPVLGTMENKAEFVTFTNSYNPTDKGKKTDIEVYKTISFLQDYTPPELPDFQFELELKRKMDPLEEHNYSIVDVKTGAVVETGKMYGNKAVFSLRGGQKAVFKDIDTNIDYKVTELELPETENPDGWKPTDGCEVMGSTVSPITPIMFNNASAVFAVTKWMEDDSLPDKVFTFQLTKGESKNSLAWGGVKYYLYSAVNGEQIEPEKSEDGTPIDRRTDANGQFKLKPGQTAVFVGVEMGINYNVSEISDPDYIQTLPNSTEGYTDRTTSHAVEELLFKNQEAKKALTVTKRLVYLEDDERCPSEQQMFYFILSEGTKVENTSEEDSTFTYTPVAGTIYTKEVGGSQYQRETDDKGGFWVGANETVRFSDLKKGKNYRVEEQILGSYSAEYELAEGQQNPQIGTLDGNNGLNFEFENLYTPDKLDLHLVKASSPMEDTVLQGAQFRLVRVDSKKNADNTNNDGTDEEGIGDKTESEVKPDQEIETEIGVYETDEQGNFSVPDLSSGTYRLYEIKAPKGYQLMAEPVEFRIVRMGSKSLQIFLKKNGKEETVEQGNDFKDWKNSNSENVDVSKAPEGYLVLKQSLVNVNDELHLKVYNDMLYDLPSAGGPGIFLYILSGIVLMMTAGYVYLKRCRSVEA